MPSHNLKSPKSVKRVKSPRSARKRVKSPISAKSLRSQANGDTVNFYCLREKKRVDVPKSSLKVTKLNNSKKVTYAYRGTCPSCGATLMKFISVDEALSNKK